MKRTIDALTNPNTYKAPAAVITALAATACGVSEASSSPQGEFNPDITSVSIQEGANIRENPVKTDEEFTNLVGQMPSALTVEVGGTRTSEDNNGVWYAVPAEALMPVADEKMKERLKNDKDGQVWINDDKVEPSLKAN